MTGEWTLRCLTYWRTASSEQGQETDTENKERGGGLRALDGNEGGRNAACQEAAKINLIYIILCNIQS